MAGPLVLRIESRDTNLLVSGILIGDIQQGKLIGFFTLLDSILALGHLVLQLPDLHTHHGVKHSNNNICNQLQSYLTINTLLWSVR